MDFKSWNFLCVLLTLGLANAITTGRIDHPLPNPYHTQNHENISNYENYQIRPPTDFRPTVPLPGPSNLEPFYSSTIHKESPSLKKKGKADKRSGISVEKTPPDLQFGLAFTVPFISLSTDRLLSTVSGHRGYNSLSDIMSILKLNVGGLVLAAVVGIAALFFVPAVFAGKGGGLGGLTNLFQNSFVPGFLEHVMPGLGLNKPLGFGQYDNTLYNDEYGNNLPYGINRKDTDTKSRAVNDNQNNGTNAFNEITHFVGEYLGQAQSCALYAMCSRGRDEKRMANSGDRGGRKFKLTTVDHAIEVIQAVGEDIPGLDQLKQAYDIGHGDNFDCDAKFKECKLGSPAQISNYINNIGEFIFS